MTDRLIDHIPFPRRLPLAPDGFTYAQDWHFGRLEWGVLLGGDDGGPFWRPLNYVLAEHLPLTR